MTRSVEEIERLEQELNARIASSDAMNALERVRQADGMIYPKEQSSRPIHRSTRGQWQSQSKGGILLPRRRR